MDSPDEDMRFSSYLRLKRRKTPLGRRGEWSVAEGRVEGAYGDCEAEAEAS